MNIPILSAGIACIIAAIVGGGLKAFGVEIRELDSIRRQVTLALFGVVLVLGSSAEKWVPFVSKTAESWIANNKGQSKGREDANNATPIPPPPNQTSKKLDTPQDKDPAAPSASQVKFSIPAKSERPTDTEPATQRAKPSTASVTHHSVRPAIVDDVAHIETGKHVSLPDPSDINVSMAQSLSLACDAGEWVKCVTLGNQSRLQKNLGITPAKALTLFQRACDGGLALGCNQVGNFYETNLPTRDYAQAALFYKRACDMRELIGCVNLGGLYKGGRGVNRDYGQAATLFKKACDGGEVWGCVFLGEIYENGWGVPINLAEAQRFYKRACDTPGDTQGASITGCEALEIMAKNQKH